MKERLTLASMRFPLPAILVLLIYVLSPLRATPQQEPPAEGPALNKALARRALPGTHDLQLIVRLTRPSVVEWARAEESRAPAQRPSSAGGRSHMDLQSSRARSYQGELAADRRQFIENMAGLSGVEIQGSLDTVMNAVIARVPMEHYSRVRRMPGVGKVYFSRPQRLVLDASAVLLNAQSLWDKAGGRSQAGRGAKIGIIDSGIDFTHPMFTGSSLTAPAGYPKGESAFTNGKVIVARNYINLLAHPQPVSNASDEVGHGTFVAAEAAGNQVTAPLATISGMAPGAFLGNYKVFGTPGINDTATTAAIVAAIDAAVADGMDVMSLSLGALDYAVPSDDPEVAAIENAVAAGVVVAVAAGNDGPGTHTISSPGSAPSAITVGSVSNSRTFSPQLRVTAPSPVPSNLSNISYLSGDGPSITAPISSSGVVDVQTLNDNGLACSALPSGSLRSKIALIERGSCTFASKVSNAASDGAIAVIVYDNIANENLIGMAGLSDTTIPAVMISNSDGLALKDFLAAHAGATQVEIDAEQTVSLRPTTPRILSSFSAEGPAADFSIKPDLVAIGENVYSATQNSNSQGEMYSPARYIVVSGTSFSTPMVAGAAAGVRQLLPQLNALDIKSVLTSTASRSLTVDGKTPPTVIQAGSGLLDMGSASAAQAVFTPSNLNFGTQSYSGSLSLTRALSIRNISSTTDQYAISVDPIDYSPALTFDQGTTGSVAPGQTVSINLSLQVTAPLGGGIQGFVLIKSAQTSITYRVPYWAGLYVPDPSRVLLVSQGSSGTDRFGALAAALAAARPGNIIEISDSGTYAAGLTISTNSEGLPLNGITIRAAAGQTPTLDGTGLGDQADIMIVGLQNVLLQGLKITGGSTGVQLLQSSLDFPLSATIDHCNISGMSEGVDPTGLEIDGGGTVEVTQSTISNCSGTGILADEGAYLTLLSSTVQNNGDGGVDALFSNIDVLNSTVTNNTSAGLVLYGCSGTIDGSVFSANLGSFGDGIEVGDGNFTITNNTFDSNDRAGIGFFSMTGTGAGPVAYFARNIVRLNKIYGVLSNPGRDLRIDANLIKDNGRGIRLTGSTSALLTNNIIVRSTNGSSGDGVEVAGSTVARLVNNTIYQNALQGIVLSSGASVSVFNTIVSSNRSGDIQGLGAGDIQFSLVGDRTLSSGHNITGNPKFVAPDADVFDLSPGSPALDAGSNGAANLPFLDFNRRLRVAGTAAAGASVDIGATELNSSYPLVFPLVANGSQPALGDSLTTGIATVNYGNNPAAVSFTAYTGSGALLSGSTNPAARSINPGAQLPILGFQLFGYDFASSSLGGVLASSLQRLAGFFVICDSDFTRFVDGVTVSDQADTDLILMRHEFDASGRATYVLFNPGVNVANVTATLYSSSGSAMDVPKSATVAPKGQVLFGFNAVTSSSGYVRVRSDRPITGLELYGPADKLSALVAVSPGSEARLFFPHFAANQGFTTLIGMVNSNSTVTNLVLTAYGDDGLPQGTRAYVTLQPNAQLLQSVNDLFDIGQGSLVTGYVIAESDQSGIQGFASYHFDDGTHQSAAAVPFDSVLRQRLLFSHVVHQVPASGGGTYQTGVALLNPFGVPVEYTIRVYDSPGNVVAERKDILGPRQKVAKILSHPVAGAGFFTQSLPLSSGHIEVLTDYGLMGLEVFFTEDLSQLVIVRAQSAN